MPELSWTAPALQDLRHISAFLDDRASVAIAIRMLGGIRAKAELLRAFPQAGPPVPDTSFRSLRVPNTPYLLIYRLQTDAVQILRVYHDRQNWREDSA